MKQITQFVGVIEVLTSSVPTALATATQSNSCLQTVMLCAVSSQWRIVLVEGSQIQQNNNLNFTPEALIGAPFSPDIQPGPLIIIRCWAEITPGFLQGKSGDPNRNLEG